MPYNDHCLPDEWIDRKEPWESIEPEDKPADLVRAARIEAVHLLNAFGSSLESVLCQPEVTLREVKVRFYGIAFALGLNLCEGLSQTQIAQHLGYERATVSKVAVEFCAANNLSPSFYMKSGGTGASYQSARLAAIERENGKASRNGSVPIVPSKGRSV
jgi:hypothetical protein